MDFSYNNTTISSSGGIKPINTNTPLDIRTVVNNYSDIFLIPNPYIGMTITVKVDETNNNKMTDYKVKSLKSNTLGMNNTVINEIERLDAYVGVNGKANNSDLLIEINRIYNLENVTEEISSQLDNIKTKVDKIEQGDTLVTTSIIDSTLTLTTDKLQTTIMQDNTTIVLPSVSNYIEIHLFFNTESELTLILPNIKWQSDITIEANKTYEFIFTYYDSWLGGCLSYE